MGIKVANCDNNTNYYNKKNVDNNLPQNSNNAIVMAIVNERGNYVQKSARNLVAMSQMGMDVSSFCIMHSLICDMENSKEYAFAQTPQQETIAIKNLRNNTTKQIELFKILINAEQMAMRTNGNKTENNKIYSHNSIFRNTNNQNVKNTSLA